MKIAYISHHKRPCYEFNWFSEMDFEKIKFLDTDFKYYPEKHSKNVEYCKVDYAENIFANKFFHSTASLIRYKNFESYLEDVDVIIVLEVFSSLSRQFLQYCKNKNKKVVVLVYELIKTHPLYYIPTHFFNRRYCIANADLFVCVSDKAKEHLLSLGAENNKIKVVYPGIETGVFYPTKDIDSRNGIVFVGKAEFHKGIDIFLNLAYEIKKDFKDLNIGIIGSGRYRDDILNMQKKIEGLKYIEVIDNNKIPLVLNEYQIYVLPARDTYKFGLKIGSEQFGFTLVEAMACGLAVVSTKCGAIPEIITPVNFTCEQDDYRCLYGRIVELLKNRENIYKISTNNIQVAKKRYDIKNQSFKLKEVLENVAN